MNLFKQVLLLGVLQLAVSVTSTAAVDGCVEPGDINDDRLRYWTCRLWEDGYKLKFDVEGYSETFLRDGRSNRSTLSILSIGDTWVRSYVGNTGRAQAYRSTPENDQAVGKYCDGQDVIDSLLDFDTQLEIHQDPDSTGSLVGDISGFKRFRWSKPDGSEVVLRCNRKWF